MTDSSTGGYLLPLNAAPLEDDPLADALQAMVVGVTGLAGNLVRPRWQPTPPPQPPANVNWAAIGVITEKPDVNSYVGFDPNGNGGQGIAWQQRHEDILVMASFHGPLAQGYAKRLIMGLGIAQNREALGNAGIKIKEVGPPRHAPQLENDQYIPQVDIEMTMRRNVHTSYAVRPLLTATIQLSGQNADKTITNTFTISE